MKKALQAFALALAAVVMLTAAAAQDVLFSNAEGLIETAPLQGILKRPDGEDTSRASFVLHYQYPQFLASTDADRQINRYYQDLAADSAYMTLENDGEEASIACEVVHNTQRYLSVIQRMTVESGNGQRERISADTFARDGLYAGQILNLSQVLGLEETRELTSEFGTAEKLAYQLIWQIVESDMQNADGDYPEGLTLGDLQSVLMPETDFYLDADGNIVFFIQAGELAGEIAGVLHFPFAAAELLSAIQK